MAHLFDPHYQVLDASGDPLSGAKLYFYQVGTTTEITIYQDADLTTPHTNPVIADSAGRFAPIYVGDSAFKTQLDTAADVGVQTVQYVIPSENTKGTDISAGATLTLPIRGNYFHVTGTGQTITAISERNEGQQVTFQFNGANTLTHNATSLILPGGANITTVAGDAAIMVSEGSGNWRCVSYQLSSLPPEYHSGLAVTNNATDTEHDLDIATGAIHDDTDTVNLTLTSALTKRIDASWAVGTNQGMLDGSESSAGTPDNSTWYYIYVIKRSDTGVVDILASESASSPTLPSGYDYKKLIFAVLTDGSGNIRNYTLVGDECHFFADIASVPATTIGTSEATYTLDVPRLSGVMAIYAMYVFKSAASPIVYVYHPDKPAPTPSATGAVGTLRSPSTSAGIVVGGLRVATSASGQVQAISSADSTDIAITTQGFRIIL